jgi:hypothetical protein
LTPKKHGTKVSRLEKIYLILELTPVGEKSMQATTKLIENDHPLNQLAAEKLKEVGEYPEPELLHALQLAKWAVDQKKVLIYNDNLEGNLDNLLYRWNPQNVMLFLEWVDEDGDPSFQEPRNLSPLQLALWVLDWLDSRLCDQVEGYSSGRSKLPVNVL